MQLLASVVYWVFTAYGFIFVARLILDLVLSVNKSFRPRGFLLVVSELVMTLTDPPLKLIRSIWGTVPLGSFRFDFSWTFCFLMITVIIGISHAYL